jgi:hypothetical protein
MHHQIQLYLEITLNTKPGSQKMKVEKKLKRERYFKRLNKGDYNYLFIHINKNAGRSIEQSLQITKFHATALEYKKQIAPEIWETLFTFAFVRNPWDRAVSLYKYRVLRGRVAESTPFKHWLSETFSDLTKKPYMKRVNAPQMKWLVDESGKIIVDFIGRFENLEEDFQTLCNIINVDTQLLHINKTKHKHYSYYYDKECYEIVYNWFKEDIDNFNYGFEDIACRL